MEETADELLRKSLEGVWKHSAKADILTPWKQQDRWSREVYVASGTPDPAIRQGMFHRAANATRPELNCLGGETEVIVRDRGAIRIDDLDSTTQEVLTSNGWGKAEFQFFGEQQLYRIEMIKGLSKKVVDATASHRWFVYGRGTGVYKSGPRAGKPLALKHCRTVIEEKFTKDLMVGSMMVCKYPPLLIGQTNPSSFGIAHGFTFGDGSRVTNKRGVEGGTYVDLFGDKMCLLPYFPKPTIRRYPRPDVTVETIRVIELPGFFKEYPEITESVPYLYGWLAGYFAADGTVSEDGCCRLFSHRLNDLLFIRDVCYRLGIIVSSPTSNVGRNPFNGQPHIMHCISIDKWSLTDRFFCNNNHRERWKVATTGKSPTLRNGWIIKTVEPIDIRPVYCAVVPSTEDFVLADYLLTGNSRLGISRPRTGRSTLSAFVQEHGYPNLSGNTYE